MPLSPTLADHPQRTHPAHGPWEVKASPSPSSVSALPQRGQSMVLLPSSYVMHTRVSVVGLVSFSSVLVVALILVASLS